MAKGRLALGQVLKEMDLISEGELQEALAVQKERGGALGKILTDHGFIPADDMLFALATQQGMEIVDVSLLRIPDDVLSRVQPSVAKLYGVVPIRYSAERNVLTVAMADPMNVGIFDDLKFMLDGTDVVGAVSTPDEVQTAIDKFYGAGDDLDELMKGIAEEAESGLKKGDSYDLMELEAAANLAPVIKLLNLVLLTAIKDRASDIHLEPFEHEFKVRYRVDGALLEMAPPPRHLALPLISRAKIMSNLNIAETRMPQDGRIELTIGGRPIDLRTSTLPTMSGESVCMRVLDRAVVQMDLESLGLRDIELDLINEFIKMPNGIIIVTGPTGCGKTTTLYAALNRANDEAIKIITTEDPVEYDLDGIMQIPINEAIGVTYAKCLRSILRQDPDMILVGEIRDLETAEMAAESSLTGHVVFTTLHTNDAPSTITRLLDIGVEPFLIAATLKAIVAQRLVRITCTHCKEMYEPSTDELIELQLDASEVEGKKFHYGKGCDHCNNTGYKGRFGIFEVMVINDRIMQLILDQASTELIRIAARESGMRTLREGGLNLIYDGITTVEEVVRETIMLS